MWERQGTGAQSRPQASKKSLVCPLVPALPPFLDLLEHPGPSQEEWATSRGEERAALRTTRAQTGKGGTAKPRQMDGWSIGFHLGIGDGLAGLEKGE